MNGWQRWFPLLSLLWQKRNSSPKRSHQASNSHVYPVWKENLIAAILQDDAARVRELIQTRPIPRPDNRLYGVITGSEEAEVGLIVVRNDGTRLSPDETIETEVDILNLTSEPAA